MAAVIPIIFIVVIGVAALRRVNVYSCFTEGAEGALKFTLSLLPCLAAVFMMCALFEESGLSAAITRALSPAAEFLGIPKELTKLVLIKPLSGSGSLAYLTQIISQYGADSRIARCACICYGSSETVFYLSAVYFAGLKSRAMFAPMAISLISSLAATIAGCALC